MTASRQNDLSNPGELVAAMPFATMLGVDLSGATREEVRGSPAGTPTLRMVAGILYGGRR